MENRIPDEPCDHTNMVDSWKFMVESIGFLVINAIQESYHLHGKISNPNFLFSVMSQIR